MTPFLTTHEWQTVRDALVRLPCDTLPEAKHRQDILDTVDSIIPLTIDERDFQARANALCAEILTACRVELREPRVQLKRELRAWAASVPQAFRAAASRVELRICDQLHKAGIEAISAAMEDE